jgi:formamidopyrimidine-DNA glycosylase
LLAELSSETLIIHLGMSGSFDVDRGGREPQRHDHVVFQMSSGATVTFNDPRRFGLMDIAARGRLERYPAPSAMGPEPLSAEFDAATLARACRGKKVALKLALLDQRVVAGLGNIYASEALIALASHPAGAPRRSRRPPAPRASAAASRPPSRRC